MITLADATVTGGAWSARMDAAEADGLEGCFVCGFACDAQRESAVIPVWYRDGRNVVLSADEAAGEEPDIYPSVHSDCVGQLVLRLVETHH